MNVIVNEVAFGNHALWLASLGLSVFPINPKAGTPYGNQEIAILAGIPIPENGKGGFHFATTDQSVINKWGVVYPNALIGIRTGAASGIYVLDVDRKNGKDGFNTVLEKNWKIPVTPCEPSKSGGAHYYLKIPRDGDQRWKTDAGMIGEGLDRKGDGGYVVWCGADLTQPMAPPPEWMLTAGHQINGERKPLGTMSGPSFEAVRDALDEINPNDLGYPEWMNLIMAYRQAATGLATEEVVRAGFDKWCTSYEKQ